MGVVGGNQGEYLSKKVFLGCLKFLLVSHFALGPWQRIEGRLVVNKRAGLRVVADYI